MLYFHKQITALLNKKRHGILPATLLISLVIHKSFVSDKYIEDIDNMKCRKHHTRLENTFIEQKDDMRCRYLC